jgi:hypothetical protein
VIERSSVDASGGPEAVLVRNGIRRSINRPLPPYSPSRLFAVLLGLDHATVDAIFVGRLAGAALLAIGVASWIARTDTRTPAHLGLLTGILIYNAAATLLLAYAGAILKMVGVLLWPAVAAHAILAVWCFSCLQSERHGDRQGHPPILNRSGHDCDEAESLVRLLSGLPL